MNETNTHMNIKEIFTELFVGESRNKTEREKKKKKRKVKKTKE
jgi:hypothetical protein